MTFKVVAYSQVFQYLFLKLQKLMFRKNFMNYGILQHESALVFLFFMLNHSHFSKTLRNTEKLKIRETRE